MALQTKAATPPSPPHYLVRVKEGYGTYTAARIKGLSASCTMGARAAVERLAAKIYGDDFRPRIEEDHHAAPAQGVTWWRIYFPEVN